MVKYMFRLQLAAVIAALALLVCPGTGSARGTFPGTVIVNATLTNMAPPFVSSTNAGELSAMFSNAAGTKYDAFVKAPPARTAVSNGYDLSPVYVRTPGTNYAAAGSTVFFTNWQTNWGNGSANLRFRILKQAATGTWTNAYALYLNGLGVSSNAETVNNVFSALPPDLGVPAVIRVTVPPGMVDGSSNRFMVVCDDGAAFPGDQWPVKGALSPATPDTNNRRDYQTNYFVVRVAGPIVDITKSVDITSGIRPYQVLTYTIVVTNRGSAPAFKVAVRDVLPANVTNIIGTVRVWTNTAVSSNTLTEASGDGDMLALTNKILKVRVPVIQKNKTARIRFEVRVK